MRTVIIEKASQSPFLKAEIIESEKLVFCSEFREYCRENRCGKYGVNYSCPPDCGTFEEMKERALKYKNTLVLQSSWKIEDFTATDKIDKAKKEHNGATLRLVKELREMGFSGIMAGASNCNLCPVCEREKSASCKFPELSFSCLSAYCINVAALAGECGMDYQYKDGMLSFFSAYFFNL